MIEPGMPDLLVEYGNEMIFQRGDGKLTVGNHLIADEKTWGEMCSGYRCAWCLQAQSQAWPEECEFEVTYGGATRRCSDFGAFPRGKIREHQMEYLGQQMRGYADYTPPDPHQLLDDERDYWKKTKTGIVVPNRPGIDAA